MEERKTLKAGFLSSMSLGFDFFVKVVFSRTLTRDFLLDLPLLDLSERIDVAAKAIRKGHVSRPRVGIILGTGLGGLAAQIESSIAIPYAEIPHFPVSTVESHAGQLVCGRLRGIEVVAMEGRFHYYEGYSMQEVTFPVRVMRALGVEILIVTNAAGGMNPQLELADVVLIEDHINLMGDNPLRGLNDDDLGPRFPDMAAPYDRTLIQLAQKSALELAIPCHKGVFVAVAGPNLETRAEYRMLRMMGADVVGMSTVPEVIVAVHGGLRVLGFSIVTDVCLPDALEAVDIRRIIEVAGRGGERLTKLIGRVLEQLG
jgi:purine-nucleoside phosphorylase